ncbi:Rieske 2Fe-2S domain-containing protein [Paenibacillus lycopersici]|uniref:Rieske 2Fe-2S domain-containing protein n=1 Tax=Paenibacillus lycopersici TaxID=2704462 RepID=A0A6C0FUK7_9BACL|nr:Rieske 2Fe-2S domain-containing protein [Paenibacillus lycopersici]QHT60838.1 Rieske 2Fe-2S domain-containing protein [Paenibacillus lycopersici]
MDRKMPDHITRRAFLGTAAKVALGAAGLVGGSAGLFYYGAVKHRKVGSDALPPNIVRLGEVADLKLLQGVAKVAYEAEYIDAWYTKPVKGFVYVTVGAQGQLLIMSPACSHLGCDVVPASEAQQGGNKDMYFWCPCHGAGFDSEGGAVVVVDRGLDTYEPIISGGSVFFDVMKPIPGETIA